MKKFAPFLIKLDQDDDPRFLHAARQALVPPWSFHSSQPGIIPFIHFRRDALANSPPLILSLVRHDSETLGVCNIIPKQGCLSLEHWHPIFLDFQTAVLDKIRQHGLDFVTFIGVDRANIARRMHPFAWKLLRTLASAPSTDRHALHPIDHIHFLEFIAVLHLTGHRLDPQDLGAWLREQGFTQIASSRLQDEFDYHLQLLKLYDRIPKSKPTNHSQP